MTSIALRYASNEEEAMQSMNFGFLKVLRGISKYKTEFALATWIRNVMVNHMIDEFRKNVAYKERIQVSDHQEWEVRYDDQVLNKKWEEDELRAMLRQLPTVTEKVFNLYAIDGYKHREIAEIMKISAGTSKWHVSEARKRLQSIMAERAKNEKKRVELTR
ncbi:MAG: RNA polymerase sigma factor [Bacteroidia bacterium]|nr:RNA polymerase sigma factor [Bacteroidia bacterium]